jgi:hypothetical protein
MRAWMLLLLPSLLVLFTPPLVAEDLKPTWVNLLEGSDLAKHWDTKGNWKLDKEGVVTLEPRPGETGWQRYDAYLWSKKQYKDFEIDFEYRVQKGGNSGFYFRVGDLKTPVANGIEVQIYDSGSKKPDAKLTDHDSGGIIPSFPPTKNAAKPAGEWNRFVITVKDNKLTIVLNGEKVNELDLAHEKVKSRPATGWIGFQDHGLPLSLRNIKVREW